MWRSLCWRKACELRPPAQTKSRRFRQPSIHKRHGLPIENKREAPCSRRDELHVGDLELASFICVTTIEALTHNAVLHHSKLLSDEKMEALIDEGARLVTGYLKGDPAPPKGRLVL
jgi:hypothetical protein